MSGSASLWRLAVIAKGRRGAQSLGSAESWFNSTPSDRPENGRWHLRDAGRIDDISCANNEDDPLSE